MCPCFRKNLLLLAALSIFVTGCTSARIKPDHMAQVEGGVATTTAPPATACTTPATDEGKSAFSSATGVSGTGNGGMPAPNKMGERFDGDAEQDIAQKVLIAWRTALAHKRRQGEDDATYKKLREADEKESIAQLDVLDKKYPSHSTVLLMKGQVYEQFGKRKESVKCYKDASTRNLENGMALLKAAEEERKSGEIKTATADYRKLLSLNPHFQSAQLGLAQCLLAKDPKSPEAKNLLKDALINDPSCEAAKQLLKNL